MPSDTTELRDLLNAAIDSSDRARYEAIACGKGHVATAIAAATAMLGECYAIVAGAPVREPVTE